MGLISPWASVRWEELPLWFAFSSACIYNPRSQTLLIFWWPNMYNRLELVCTVNVYIPAIMGRRPILRYQVLKNCTHFTYSQRTDSYVICREYCKQFKIILPDTFCQQYRHFKYRKKKKIKNTYSLILYFYLLYLGGYFNIFCKLPDQS